MAALYSACVFEHEIGEGSVAVLCPCDNEYTSTRVIIRLSTHMHASLAKVIADLHLLHLR